MEHFNKWWNTRVVYQIYPRSFCDSNGDGIGDIPGIITKLDYLKSLGIGIIWLSPLYQSPNDDNGYDIADYCSIHPDFGTIEDFKELLAQAHKRDIKIIMDLVVNHTSDEHPWFIKSREAVQKNQSAQENPYRDYYYWRHGKKNGTKPPNNWSSFFSGSAWQKDEVSGLYYLRLFSKKQPDLNWHNPAVKEEIKNVLKFWLDMGIDGFRCDVINVIYKELENDAEKSLPDGKRRIILTGREHYHSRPGCHAILHELRETVLSNYDCFTVGETVMVTPPEAADLCAPERRELDMVFSFEHMETDQINNKWFKTRYKPAKLIRVLAKWQKALEWNTVYLENHDQPRSVSRFGSEKTPALYQASAKMLATLVLTLRGTPYIYEGQELGMTNGGFTSMEQLRDVESFMTEKTMRRLHFPRRLRLSLIMKTTRDNARTPMQWTNGNQSGFTSGTPWIEVNQNYRTINAATEIQDPHSILNYYKKLIAFRTRTTDLQSSPFTAVCTGKYVFAYFRGNILVILNMSGKKQKLPAAVKKALACTEPTALLGNYADTESAALLQPYEARVISVNRSTI